MTHARSTLPEGGRARRVYLLLRDGILSGQLPAGERLPGEVRLAEFHDVSRVTLRRALDALEADGLVERRAGSGTRVIQRPMRPALTVDVIDPIPLLQMMAGYRVRLLSFGFEAAGEGIAANLGVPIGTEVQRAVRVRSVESQPFSHLTTFVPADLAAAYSEADLARTPLYRLLERSGVAIASAQQSVTAVLAAPQVAEALDIAPGVALLHVRRIVRDMSGRGVEWLSALYRPDLFRLDMSLERVGGDHGRHWQPIVGRETDAP